MFLLNGVWSLVFLARLFVTSQVVISGAFLFAGAAFLLASRADGERRPGRIQRWLVVLPLGLLSGWITAAALVGFATTLAAVGTLNGGLGEALLGAGLLLAGGLIAAGIIRTSKNGPWQGILAYSAAVLWALVAVVVNQYGASLLTTAAAIVAVVPVVLSLLSALRDGPPSRSSGKTVRPRVA